jgi:hypothetical protein
MAAMGTTLKFAGFNDWVEIFSAGTQTDSAGKTREFTEGELDQIIANHNPEHPAPIVIGHPKADAPSYGWSQALKRDGKTLLGKFTQVEPQFSKMVEEGRFRNRSIKLLQTDNGLKLVHVGFLGAAPPAIEGLRPMQFDAAAPGETYEFDWGDSYNLSLIARGMRRLREFFIAQFGQETADRVTPDYDIAALERSAMEESMAPEDDDSAQPIQSSFQQGNQGATTVATPTQVQTFTQADIDAARAAGANDERTKREAAEAQLAEFKRGERLASARQFVQSLIDDGTGNGRLLPAQAVGLAEFLADLDDGVEFEFTAPAEGNQAAQTVKRPRGEFLRGMLKALPPQIKLGRQIADNGGEVDTTSSDAIVRAAQEFQASEKAKGREIEWHEAVNHVTSKGK